MSPAAPFPANEAARLDALRRYHILDTAPEESFDDFTLLASTICQTPMASMTLIDSERQWFKASIGFVDRETPREHAFCAHAILGPEVLVVEDATSDVRFSENPFVTAAPHIRFYAGAPLIDGDGHALGSICVIDQQPRPISDTQRNALQALSRRIIAQMELRRISAEMAALLTHIKTLRGLLPICAHCKSIRSDDGYWQSVEEYVVAHTEADFSHGMCPGCLQQHYPKIFARMQAEGKI
jgi:GAF domain-containing protein